MSKSRPELCRVIANTVLSIVDLTEQHEGTQLMFDRLRTLALDLIASANIANYRNPSAFTQIDQMVRSIHSLLITMPTAEYPIEQAFELIEEIFIDMWGVSVADQIEREHETRIKGSDMQVQPQQPDGLVQIVDGRPVRKTRIH